MGCLPRRASAARAGPHRRGFECGDRWCRADRVSASTFTFGQSHGLHVVGGQRVGAVERWADVDPTELAVALDGDMEEPPVGDAGCGEK